MADNFQKKVSFIWRLANYLHGDYKRYEYQDVILPLTVLKRLDDVLKETKENVLKKKKELTERGISERAQEDLLKNAAGYPFYNTSKYTFEKLTEDPNNIAKNLKNYLNGFSKNARDIIESFKFNNEITKLEEKNLLYKLVEEFNQVNFHPDEVPNHEMGTIFEELIRKFSENSNEEAGQHFTPREVIRLMAKLILVGNGDLSKEDIIRKIYDPACGTGGMLTIAKDEVKQINPTAKTFLFGQELNEKTYAIAKADMLIKGEEADNIKQGNSFTEDKLNRKEDTFHYMMTNPPFGVSWNGIKEFIEEEAEKGSAGRFEAGTPRVSDKQILFLQHMISKIRKKENGGSRIATVFNGSPLFTGDAGSGESEIRRWILENDWLETIVALPDQMFYNTGIHTYVWIVTNKKKKERKGRVQLIDAREMYKNSKKSLGEKRHEFSEEHIQKIIEIYQNFEEGDNCKIYNTDFFGYKKITVERPKRRKVEITEDGFENLKEERTFKAKTTSDKTRENLLDCLRDMEGKKYRNGKKFKKELKSRLKEKDDKIRGSLMRATLRSFSSYDPEAEIITDSKGKPKPDNNLRDYERVPLNMEIGDYFEEEVKPHLPNAWIDKDKTKIGYEINFTRYFYEYEPPRSPVEIAKDIKKIEKEAEGILDEILET